MLPPPPADRARVEAAAIPNQAPALRLGELLVRDGAATQEHVDQALELQPLLRKRLGEILVEKRWTTSKAVAVALGAQYALDFVDLTQVAVDTQLAALLKETFAPSIRRSRFGASATTSSRSPSPTRRTCTPRTSSGWRSV